MVSFFLVFRTEPLRQWGCWRKRQGEALGRNIKERVEKVDPEGKSVVPELSTPKLRPRGEREALCLPFEQEETRLRDWGATLCQKIWNSCLHNLRSVWDTEDLASEKEGERKKKKGRGGGSQPDVLEHAYNLSPREAAGFKASLKHTRNHCLKCGGRESNDIKGKSSLCKQHGLNQLSQEV